MKNFIRKIFPDSLVLKDDFYETTGELYDRMFASLKEDDFNFYLEYAKRKCSELLDLAAGTGRLSLFLSEKGFDVTALEISPTMINVFKQKKRSLRNSLNGKIHIIRGDASKFHLHKNFRYVIMGYNSFNHFLNKKDQLNCLQCINRCMKTGGVFAFEILPVIENIPGGKKLRYERKFNDTGEKIIVYSKIKQDIPDCHKIWWFFEIIDKNGKKTKATSSFIRAEINVPDMVNMLEESGFKITGIYNDYKRDIKVGDKKLFVTEKVLDVFA